MHHSLPAIVRSLPPPHAPSDQYRQSALDRQAQLTKPPGSLGRVEDLAVQMAALQGTGVPAARPASVLLFAADHPVALRGVSPYPQSVTGAMVANFRAGGAAASVLAAAHELPLRVIDAGVVGGDFDQTHCAGDLSQEDAMSPETFSACIQLGRQSFEDHCNSDRVCILGEMGIGNTTAAAALAASLLELKDGAQLVGRGTGAAGDMLSTKREVVRSAVNRVRSDQCSATEKLRRLGGREMAALYGAFRAALAAGCLVLIDGFIVSAVAAVVLAEYPEARAGLVFAHRSAEQGHQKILEHVDARPLLDLDMRLGEGSGALLAFPLLDQACRLHNDMATFASAAVPTSKADATPSSKSEHDA